MFRLRLMPRIVIYPRWSFDDSINNVDEHVAIVRSGLENVTVYVLQFPDGYVPATVWHIRNPSPNGKQHIKKPRLSSSDKFQCSRLINH